MHTHVKETMFTPLGFVKFKIPFLKSVFERKYNVLAELFSKKKYELS